jgi:hypothetical protein
MRPGNFAALVALELADARYHQERATYWTAQMQLVRAEARDDYRAEVAYHAGRMAHHLRMMAMHASGARKSDGP